MEDFLAHWQAYRAFKISKQNLENNLALLNRINIFPVADKDTGNNMFISFDRCLEKIEGTKTTRELFDIAGKTLVLVGMGNSGTILSLFFSGISDYFSEENIEKIDKNAFLNAFVKGANKIKDGLNNPVQGTILSVAQETAQIAQSNSDQFSNIEDLMTFIADTAYKILPKTATQNPKLKDFHVIDSGALGFCMILDGFAAGFNALEKVNREYDVEINGLINTAKRDSSYKYCTEFITNTPAGGSEKLRQQLEEIGDCVIPVESEGKIKIHVHTNNPDAALFIGALCGELKMVKVDNMQQESGPVKVFLCNEDLSQRCIESMNYQNVFCLADNGLEKLRIFVNHCSLKNQIILMTSVQELGPVENLVSKIRFYESDEALINKLFSE